MMRFPRWLSWIVLIGLGWLLYVGNTRETGPVRAPQTDAPAMATAEPKRYREIEALFDGERWKKGMFPNYQSPEDACRMEPPAEGMLHAYALVQAAGSGEGLDCGDTADFTIVRRNADGSAGKATDVTLTLGQQQGFDGLLLGMRSGEQRLLLVKLPKKLAAMPSLPANTQLLVEVTRRTASAAPVN